MPKILHSLLPKSLHFWLPFTVTRIPEGDPALYDPKQYVENILVRSWKNNDIYIDDYHIDRRNLTVILTCPPEDEDRLRAICSMCSYAWVGDISELM